jgi:hypothetical protein
MMSIGRLYGLYALGPDMVVTWTFSDGRTDDRTMPAGASVT